MATQAAVVTRRFRSYQTSPPSPPHTRRLMAKSLPGPEKAGGRPRSKPAGSKAGRGRKAAAAAADEEGDSAMPDAGGLGP